MKKGLKKRLIIIAGAILVFTYNKIYVDEMKELDFTVNDLESNYIPVDTYFTDSIVTLENFITNRKADSIFYKDGYEKIFDVFKEKNEIYVGFRIWKKNNNTPVRRLLRIPPKIKYGLIVGFDPMLRFSYHNCFVKPTSENIDGLVNFKSYKKKVVFSEKNKLDFDYYNSKVCPSVKVNIFLIDKNGNLIQEKIDDEDLFLNKNSQNKYWSGQLIFDEIAEMWYSHDNSYGGVRKVSKNTLDNFNGIYSEVSFYNYKTGKYSIVDKRKVFFK